MITLMIMMSILMLICLTMILINQILTKKTFLNREKMTPFECGFDPLSPMRLPFSIQFYMISIIFLIFDIEIIIFLPILTANFFNKWINWMETTMFFSLILLMGLYIEWMDGALTWLK